LKKRGRERTYSQAVAAIQAETTIPAAQEEQEEQQQEQQVEQQRLTVPTSPVSTSTREPPSISGPVPDKGSYSKVPIMSPSANLTIPAEWEKRKDANSGQEYFYNKNTGVSQWELP